jgi:hypothetical protein
MTTNLDNDKLNEQKEEPAVGGLYGWICPVCGRGLSPYTSSCPCTINREITCGTGTTVPQFGTTVSHNAPTATQIIDTLNKGELPPLSLNNDEGLHIHKYGY